LPHLVGECSAIDFGLTDVDDTFGCGGKLFTLGLTDSEIPARRVMADLMVLICDST
jgi:hypothetical protein